MAHRATNPEPVILGKIIADKGTRWGEETRKVAQTDAQRVLEALVAEYGVEAAVRALDNQGFKGDAMRYLLNPLYEEAIRRRSMVQLSSSVASSGDAETPLTDEEFEMTADQLADEGAAICRRQGAPATSLPITRDEMYLDHP